MNQTTEIRQLKEDNWKENYKKKLKEENWQLNEENYKKETEIEQLK